MSPGGGLFSAPSHPGSIVSATTFHFRVRDGNGWDRRALTTRTLSIANRRRAGKSGGRLAPLGEPPDPRIDRIDPIDPIDPIARSPIARSRSRSRWSAGVRCPHQTVQRFQDARNAAIAEEVRRRGAGGAHRGTVGGDGNRPRHHLDARHLLHKRALAGVADRRKLHAPRPVSLPGLRLAFAGDGLHDRRRPRDHRRAAAPPSSSTTWKR